MDLVCTSESDPVFEIPVFVDIKLASRPNPFQLKRKGALPIAICGTEDFDVTTINPETIRLTMHART
jgi:hypothetical protein